MSLARALTRRHKAPVEDVVAPPVGMADPGVASPTGTLALNRNTSVAKRHVDRAQISLPLELLSTTNLLALEAPDIYPNHANGSPIRPQGPRSPAGTAGTPISPLAAIIEPSSSASSTRSYEPSDASSTGPASTAASSVSSPTVSREASPSVPSLPELNHLSVYFPQHKTRPNRSPTKTDSPILPMSPSKRQGFSPIAESSGRKHSGASSSGPQHPTAIPGPKAPAVPQRSPSRSKKPAPPGEARHRSIDTSARASTEAPSLASDRTSASSPTKSSLRGSSDLALSAGVAAATAVALGEAPTFLAPPSPKLAPVPEQVQKPERQTQIPPLHQPLDAPRSPVKQKAQQPHPFGAELAQVQAVAAEFGVSDVRIWDEEEQFLVENGLCKFGVEDYLAEIVPLFRGVFEPVVEEETWL